MEKEINRLRLENTQMKACLLAFVRVLEPIPLRGIEGTILWAKMLLETDEEKERRKLAALTWLEEIRNIPLDKI